MSIQCCSPVSPHTALEGENREITSDNIAWVPEVPEDRLQFLENGELMSEQHFLQQMFYTFIVPASNWLNQTRNAIDLRSRAAILILNLKNWVEIQLLLKVEPKFGGG